MFKQEQKEHLRQRMKIHLKMNSSLKPTTAVPYGTAGFRGPAKRIGWILYRAGILAALKCFDARQTIGVIITASHNPIQDNGIKFIDETGLMLSSAWELIVDEVCNIQEIDEFIEALEKVIKKLNIFCDVQPTKGQIFIGYDTRPSSEYLAKVVIEGINALAGGLIPVTDFKLCTTPELHWLVGETNKQSGINPNGVLKRHYWERLVAGSKMGLGLGKPCDVTRYDCQTLYVDCANGVGNVVMKQIRGFLDRLLRMELINDGGHPMLLNLECGADYVKTNHRKPTEASQTRMRYASLDGDADRLVYFYFRLENQSPLSDHELRLLDGDRIQALYAVFMAQIIKESKYNGTLSLGCVQTAYANGACTEFLKETGFQVECVDTGVKNLHRRAVQYDIGIYFEANGHGTIHLSQRARDLFTGHIKDLDTPHDPRWQLTDEEEKANCIFKVLCSVLNFYVGDGIADILLVEIILRYLDWDVRKWDALYEDRPSRLIKLAVKDKSLIKTVDAGRRCSSPSGLQAEIDAIVAGSGPHARCFVRASGTENVVRVFAEGGTKAKAEELADLVGRKTKEFCDNEGQ